MRYVFLLLVVLVVGIVALAYYRNWFQVTKTQSGDNVNYSITVDENKIREDKKKAQEAVGDFGRKAKEQASQPSEKSKEESPKP